MRTIRTAGKKAKLLAATAEGLTLSEAAHAAGIGRTAVWAWKKDDPVFAREFEQAYEAGTDVYEAEARRRAFDQSDALLIFLLKQRDPKRFNQRMLTIAGDLNNPVVVHQTGVANSNVHLYVPHNGRDRPEVIDADAQLVVTKAEADAA